MQTNLIDFIQLGGMGVSVIVILLIVKEFLKFSRNQENNFTEVIKNHLSHDAELHIKEIEAKDKLKEAIMELTLYIKKINGK